MKATTSSVLLLAVASVSLAAQRQPIGDGDRSVALYDVRDLLSSTPANLESPASRLSPSAALADLVRAFVPPPPPLPADISVVGGSHLVAATGVEQHAWIERFLRRAREHRGAVVEVEARTLAVPVAVFARDVLPVLRRGRGESVPPAVEASAEPATAMLRPGPDTDSFLTGLREREGVVEVQAPRLRCLLGQRADIFVGEQHSYVRDFTIEVAQGQTIANPVVDVIEDGTRLECASALLDDGVLGVVLESSVAEVSKPMVEVQTRIPGTDKLATIQLPRQRVARVRAALVLPPRHLALLALPAIGEHRFVVVVRAERVMERHDLPAIADDRTVWTYDVQDLIDGVNPGKRAPAGDLAAVPSDDTVSAILQGVADTVRAFLAPPLRSDEQLTSAGPSHLVLKGRAAQHAWLKGFLVAQRELGATRFSVMPDLVELPQTSYEENVLPLLRTAGLRAGASGGEHVVLPAGPETERTLAVLAAQRDAEVTHLPAVASGRFVRTECRDGLRHTTYVRDFDVQVVDGKPAGAPVEDVVRDGPLLTWSMTALPDGLVGIALNVLHMHLQRPIPKFTTSLGTGQTVTIDLPRVTVARATATLALRPGGVGVVTLPVGERGKQALILLRVGPEPGSARR